MRVAPADRAFCRVRPPDSDELRQAVAAAEEAKGDCAVDGDEWAWLDGWAKCARWAVGDDPIPADFGRPRIGP